MVPEEKMESLEWQGKFYRNGRSSNFQNYRNKDNNATGDCGCFEGNKGNFGRNNRGENMIRGSYHKFIQQKQSGVDRCSIARPPPFTFKTAVGN